MVMPSTCILAQNIESDTTVESELDIQYDSVLARAASALTTSAFQQSIDYYKQASSLKPAETYPFKMIKYVEDLAVKQKRADDLKRKAQIQNDLNRANQAIVDKKWDSAKVLFNEILSLQPQKADEEYAKSKVSAIDLELQRIVSRTPPKVEPKPIVLPKNRREARALRKLEERNAILASAAPKKPSPPITTQPKTAVVAADTFKNKQVQQKVIPPPSSTTTTNGARSDVAASQPPKELTPKPVNTTLPEKKAIVPTDTPKTQAIQQKPVQMVTNPANETIRSSSNSNTAAEPKQQQAPLATDKTISLPSVNAAPPNPAETLALNKNAVAHSGKDIQPVQPTSKNTPGTPPYSAKETLGQSVYQPTLGNAAAKPMANDIQQKTVQTPALPDNNITTFSNTEIPEKTVDGRPLKLYDSTDYVKMICQDISFIGSNAYIKVLIQNYSSTTEFLTDTLHVSIKKNNGTIKDLDQRFISNFPIIQPLKEAVLVSFAETSVKVDPDDIFIVEMRDRASKTKLNVQVPWSFYSQQKNF